MIETIGIVGCGLIGGSIAKAAKKYIGCKVYGYDVNHIEDPGVFDLFDTESSMRNHKYCDLAIICTPIGVAPEIASKLQSKMITDVLSVKSSLKHLIGGKICLSHPIAGGEESGYFASKADLFVKKNCIIIEGSDPGILPEFWSSIGMNISYLDADLHDEIYAYVSHFPQFLMFKIADLLKEIPGKEFYRLCKSNRKLWQEIFDANWYYIGRIWSDFLDIYEPNPSDQNFEENIKNALISIIPKKYLTFAGSGLTSILK